jgi:hypothetical protein
MNTIAFALVSFINLVSVAIFIMNFIIGGMLLLNLSKLRSIITKNISNASEATNSSSFSKKYVMYFITEGRIT